VISAVKLTMVAVPGVGPLPWPHPVNSPSYVVTSPADAVAGARATSARQITTRAVRRIVASDPLLGASIGR
jgi:hypothetical protein